MNNNIIEMIEQIISCDYHLKKEENRWLLCENDEEIVIRTPVGDSIAFSLDNKIRKPIAFFSNRPPSGVAKICDALLFYFHNGQGYLFVIEVKSTRIGGSEEQLNNGKIFCDWLLALCKEHSCLNYDFVATSLLLREPRKSAENREPTSHRRSQFITKESTCHFSFRYEIRNRKDISLRDFIRKINNE